MQVDFDPATVTYSDLLGVFWASHSPTSSNSDRLYQNGVFYHSERQKAIALASLSREQKKTKKRVHSSIEPANFRLAKTSDQKYYLRNDRKLWKEFSRHYPNPEGVLDSAAAAKINGYLTGNSNREQFQAFVKSLGLSASGRSYLEKRVPVKAKHWTPSCTLPSF